MRKFYQEHINKNRRFVDSLNQLGVVLPESYKARSVTDVLAMEITCKFAITPRMYNTLQEITEAFILSANGEKCYLWSVNIYSAKNSPQTVILR